MAKFSNASGSLYLNVYIDPSTQNIANNTTVVNWRITVSRTGAYLTRNEQGDSTLSLDLNGGRVHASNPHWRTTGEEFLMASGSTTVGHNADGTKSFPFSATFNPNNGLHGVITVSGNIGLATIPRSSSVSVGTGTIGSALTININRQSSSFKHTVRYAWGNKSGTIASNVDTSTTWTIPLDFANDIPNATSGTGTLFVDTYSGSTKTGTQQVNFTASVPAHIKPSFSGVTLTDTNGVARSLLSGNNFLQIISDIQVSFNGATGSYGSSITGYRAEIVNRNQVTTSNGGRLGMMNFNGSATIRASVVDSRGRQSDTRDVTINVIEYFAPILSFSAVRTRETPNIIQIVRNAKIAPITLSGSQKNVMTLTFKVAPLGSTSYTADNGSATGTFTTQHTLTNSAANMAGNYPANKSFTVIGTLADKFTSIEFSATVATESVVMSYDKDGRVGVGKIVEQGKAGSLDVAGDVYANGKLTQMHPLTAGNPSLGRIKWDNTNHVDDLIESGFYWANKGTPTGSWGVLEVYRVSDRETAQFFTSGDGGKTFARLRHYQTGVWSVWKTRGLDQFYPIGSIYQSVNATNPSTLMGGTWQRFGQGRVLVGVNETDADFNTPNKQGGGKTHRHGKGNMVARIGSGNSRADTIGFHHDNNHTGVGNPTYVISGGVVGDLRSRPLSHNTAIAGETSDSSSLQPYITVYMWQRTA